jgi:leucyl/phenylalanyl-tRNA--protein transferase
LPGDFFALPIERPVSGAAALAIVRGTSDQT